MQEWLAFVSGHVIAIDSPCRALRRTGHETAPPSRKDTKALILHLYDFGSIHEITARNLELAGELARAPLSRLFLPVVPVVSNLKTQGEKRRCALKQMGFETIGP